MPKIHRIMHHTMLLGVFLLCILLRFDEARIPHYLDNGDYDKNYLIASHMLRYGEIPLNGGGNAIGSYVYSPLYYYVTSLFLIVKDDIVFLSLANFYLQVGVLVMVYVLAKNAFDERRALMSLILFGLSPAIGRELGVPWQPTLMLFPLALSFLLLSYGYVKRQLLLVYSSCFFFVVSFVIYPAVFAISPGYACFVLVTLCNRFIPGRIRFTPHILLLPLFALMTLIVLYMPILFFILQWGYSFIDVNTVPHFAIDAESVLQNFFLRPSIFLDSISSVRIPQNIFVGGLFYFVLGGLVLVTLKFSKDTRRHAILFLLYGSIVAFFVLLAFMYQIDPIYFATRYFIPLYIPFILILSAVSSRRYITIFVFGVFCFLFLSPQRVGNAWNNLTSNPSAYVHLSYTASPAAEAIKREIDDFRARRIFPNDRFFRFVIFNTQKHWQEDSHDPMYWVFLEREYGIPLTTVDDQSSLGYRPLTDDRIIFFICEKYTDVTNQGEECKRWFRENYPRYSFQKMLLSDEQAIIFVMKRKDILKPEESFQM